MYAICQRKVKLFFLYKFKRNGNFGINFFAFSQFNGSFKALLTHQFRLLGNGSGHGACFNSFQAVVSTVKTNDKDLFACALGGFDSTESHFVILGKNCLNVGVSLQHVLGNGQAFGTVKISRLFSYNA